MSVFTMTIQFSELGKCISYKLKPFPFTVFYMESIVLIMYTFVNLTLLFLSTDKMEIIILSLLVSLCKLISRLVLRVV